MPRSYQNDTEWPLHYACRVGNLEQVQYLVKQSKASIGSKDDIVNQHDDNDATPLYYAALTGNTDICRFLLEKAGARCQGHDGARVFYVALTSDLRKLLRVWSLSAATRDPYLDRWQDAFVQASESDQQGDCVYHRRSSFQHNSKPFCRSKSIYFHRIVVQARCPALADFLHEHYPESAEDSKAASELRLDEYPEAVVCGFLEYLYTGVWYIENLLELRSQALALASKLEQQDLVQIIHTKWPDMAKRIEEDGKGFQTSLTMEVSSIPRLRKDLRKLAHWVSTPHHEISSFHRLNHLLTWSDATIQCRDCSWSVHRFVTQSVSEFLDRAWSGSFLEAQEGFLNVSEMPCTPEAWSLAIQWMYADQFLTSVDSDTALDVLELATTILCPQLASYVANIVLVSLVELENVLDLLLLARSYGFDKLEDCCIGVVALHIDKLVSSDDLRSILTEEAAEISQGGDVRVPDVPVAAEIRRAIKEADFDDEDRNARLEVVQFLVDEALQHLTQ